MPTPFESGLLNLQLFDLRRENVLREPRAWFLHEFKPESVAELLALVAARLRMTVILSGRHVNRVKNDQSPTSSVSIPS